MLKKGQRSRRMPVHSKSLAQHLPSRLATLAFRWRTDRRQMMQTRSAVLCLTVALALFAPAAYALQEFTLEEAQTRIERLEARVTALEEMVASSGGEAEAEETHVIQGEL